MRQGAKLEGHVARNLEILLDRCAIEGGHLNHKVGLHTLIHGSDQLERLLLGGCERGSIEQRGIYMGGRKRLASVPKAGLVERHKDAWVLLVEAIEHLMHVVPALEGEGLRARSGA